MTENTGKVRKFTIPPDPELPPLPQFQKPVISQRKLEEQEKQEAEALIAKFKELNREDYKDLSTAPRRRAREAALLLFFQMEMGGEDWQLAENIFSDIGLEDTGIYYARENAHAAMEDKPHSEKLLVDHAREWTVDRFASIDRCILYLALSELRRDPSDQTSVILNEAVELAKKFGDENSPAFINGILDAICKESRKDEAAKETAADAAAETAEEKA